MYNSIAEVLFEPAVMLDRLHGICLHRNITTLYFDANASSIGKYIQLFYPNPHRPDATIFQTVRGNLFRQRLDQVDMAGRDDFADR